MSRTSSSVAPCRDPAPLTAVYRRASNPIQLERAARVELLQHRCADLAGEAGRPTAKLPRLERCSVCEPDRHRLLVAAEKSQLPLGVGLDDADELVHA